jgi:hypothetical protein
MGARLASFAESDGNTRSCGRSSGDIGAFNSQWGGVCGRPTQGGGHSFQPQVQSFPLSFRVGGRQYIAVEMGAGSLRPMPGS